MVARGDLVEVPMEEVPAIQKTGRKSKILF
jgi:pyruvate kinase